MNTNNQILNIIATIRNSAFIITEIYTRGSCYQFYLILKSIFPEAIAYYNDDHVITKIQDCYYDISGKVEIKDHLLVDKYYSHIKLKLLKWKN